MKKINLLLRKCKSLSRQLSRSSSYSNIRSKSTREDLWVVDDEKSSPAATIFFVGSTRKRYVVSAKYATHPLFEALIDKSSNTSTVDQSRAHQGDRVWAVRCEVVLFDHLLWMLDNADPLSLGANNSEALEELASLYVF